MSENELTAEWSDGSLIVNGLDVSSDSPSSQKWKATKIDPQRILLYEESNGTQVNTSQGLGRFSTDMVYDLVIGLHNRKWTGMIFLDTGYGRKKLYFNAGELVFAGSDVIDDRLGEVMYRNGEISLDQLTDFAVQVDRKSKFGQVLLRSGRFSNIDLWNALKLQINEIFKSVFLVDASYIELHAQSAPVEVTFEEGLESLLDAAYTFGAQFRAFRRRVHDNVRVIKQTPAATTETGTFVGDVLELCHDNPELGVVMRRSKLSEIITLSVMHLFLANGLIKFEGLHEPDTLIVDGSFGNLKSKIDAYQFLHGIAVSAFAKYGIAFPVSDLGKFAASLNKDNSRTIFLDDRGALSAESVANILQQCIATSHRLDYFQIRMESLLRYLVQMGLDTLPPDGVKELKGAYKEMTS